jgi:hypothetical protein
MYIADLVLDALGLLTQLIVTAQRHAALAGPIRGAARVPGP